MKNSTPEGSLNVKQELEQLEQKAKIEPLFLSEWIRANKSLLVAAGATTTAGATTLAWIVEHIDEITAFLQVVRGLESRDDANTIYLEALHVWEEPIIDVLCRDDVLLSGLAELLFERTSCRRVKSLTLYREYTSQ